WEEGNGVSNVLARDMDAVLHGERLDGRNKRLHPLPVPWRQLPDGAMLQQAAKSFLIVQGKAIEWSPAGYRDTQEVPDEAMLLTPPSTLRALSARYRPLLHPSAFQSQGGLEPINLPP
ncbi:MAG TPA: hypothetical protein VN838_01280, partial [Bradyrhizobium sp.]|nr:hypothetical protein [Bradyrhizobium sp.]